MKNKGLRNLEKVLNERIKYFLKSKKMTQSNLAEKMDMTSGYLAELLNLNPKKRWNADLIDKAVRALDVPAWQLFAAPFARKVAESI
ncbi:MAG: XRE family transcriptional regulator [Desulfurellales bacterium]|nr:MAG: XRE family transcriptional regulator [Desulfurellales bacterium]